MIVTLLLFIAILGVTIFVHELGHFIFAKIAGVHIYEFALGFGPVILKKIAKDGTQYSIRAIPLGGFVSMAGEEVNLDKNKHKGKNIQDKTFLQRLLIMFMGVGNNFIFAFLVLLLMGFIYGGETMQPIISDVLVDSPAYTAGIEAGDKILKINNHKVTYRDDIALFIYLTDLKNPVTFEMKKANGTEVTYTVQAQKVVINDAEVLQLGIAYNGKETKGFFESFKYAFLKECAMFKQMFITLGNLFTVGISVKDLSGPVGIYSVIDQAKAYGGYAILSLIALLSINVGIINLIPLPAFVVRTF